MIPLNGKVYWKQARGARIVEMRYLGRITSEGDDDYKDGKGPIGALKLQPYWMDPSQYAHTGLFLSQDTIDPVTGESPAKFEPPPRDELDPPADPTPWLI